jgi:hypothetical protein
MTTTSVLNGTAPVPAVKAWMLFAASIFVIVVFSVSAFAIGRNTAPSHTVRPAITPAPAVSNATPNPHFQCRNGRPC